MSQKPSLAVVGATGAVGTVMLGILSCLLYTSDAADE